MGIQKGTMILTTTPVNPRALDDDIGQIAKRAQDCDHVLGNYLLATSGFSASPDPSRGPYHDEVVPNKPAKK